MPKIRSKKTSISISISMLPINAAMTGSALWQGLVGSGRWKFAAGVFISSYKPPPPPPPTTATGGRVPQKEGGWGQKLWWAQMCLAMFSECTPCFFFLIRKLNLKFKWRLKNKNKKDPHLILVEKYPKLRKTCRRILKVLNILKNIPENLNSSPGIRKETSEKCPLPNLIFKFGKLPKNGKTFGG